MRQELSNFLPIFELDVQLGRLVVISGGFVEAGSLGQLLHLFEDFGAFFLQTFQLEFSTQVETGFEITFNANCVFDYLAMTMTMFVIFNKESELGIQAIATHEIPY